MPPTQSVTSKPKKKKSFLKTFLKYFANVAFIAIVFWLGYVIGSGQIKIGGYKAQTSGLPADLDTAAVQQVYDSLKQNYDGQLDIGKLLDGLNHGLTNAVGDPYTVYMTPKEAKDFKDQLNGTFEGIGAELSKDKDGNLIVVSPINGFPAQKAGLMSEDIIISVNGESTADMSVDQAVSKIRGASGTKVTLKVIRDHSKTLSFTIIREAIKIPSVESKILKGNIGYIAINEFSDDTSTLTKQAADKFKQANVKGVILDLRGNPGGELTAAVDVSSIWLGEGKTILTTRRGGVVTDTYKSNGTDTLAGVPTVVLIDNGSASASEIVAGALHDNKVATLIGVKSFGKGSVQDIINLKDGAILKVTIARWYTPGGKNIDKQGIEPDQIVKKTDTDIKAKKDPQLNAAIVKIQ